MSFWKKLKPPKSEDHSDPKMTPDGREIPDPKPLGIPIGFERPPTLAQTVARLVRSHELRQAAMNAGAETFEEADDFDIPDDPVDPHTPYEVVFDPETGREMLPAEKAVLDAERRAFDTALENEKKRANARKTKKASSDTDDAD